MSQMKVEIQSKRLVKPFTPTPNNIPHNLSFMDKIAPKMYVPIILYYQPPHDINVMYQLETSLTKTLVQFYPLAGRYNKHLRVVDCNDEGVEFIEAKIDAHLHEILPQEEISDAKVLGNFIPCDNIQTVDESYHPVLSIQVTMFKCGGVALGICISHRIADAATLCLFIQAWAANTNLNKKSIQETLPSFNSAVYFPKRDLPQLRLESAAGCKIVTRRFSFDNKAISTLRANLEPHYSTSKLQFVFAVVWKALLGIQKLKNEDSRATLIVQPVNLRDKNTTPPIPKHCCGNICGLALVSVMEGENMEIQDLADKLSDSVKYSLMDWVAITSMSEDNPFLLDLKDMFDILENYYMITSWSRFPFYECDFGWGKPVWASTANINKNWIIFMDSPKGDGYEAWLSLEENDMITFQQDSNIKAFTAHFADHVQ